MSSYEQPPSIWQGLKAFIRSIKIFKPACPECKSIDVELERKSISKKSKVFICNNCNHEFYKTLL